jgi:hypothetical protein
MKIIIFFDPLFLIIAATITITLNVLLFYLKTKIEFEEVEEFEADIVEEF